MPTGPFRGMVVTPLLCAHLRHSSCINGSPTFSGGSAVSRVCPPPMFRYVHISSAVSFALFMDGLTEYPPAHALQNPSLSSTLDPMCTCGGMSLCCTRLWIVFISILSVSACAPKLFRFSGRSIAASLSRLIHFRFRGPSPTSIGMLNPVTALKLRKSSIDFHPFSARLRAIAGLQAPSWP